MTEEEQRAAAYRAQQARREAAERARYAALAGSATVAREVRESWQSLIDAQGDRLRGWQEADR